ncbi:MAG: Diguanylate cyclase, domain, partial [Gaiellaceae bacterium]|nr:Diguanylate cyclase, domain [Gaiellaceae bacterium]
AERIRDGLSRRTVPTPDGGPLAFAASFGVAAWSPGTSQEELVTAADAALYEAKRRGKNRVVEAETRLGGVRAGV